MQDQEMLPESAKPDLFEEMKQEITEAMQGRRIPARNEVRFRLTSPRGTEESFRIAIQENREAMILALTKFATGKRKLSTRNRLNNMKMENLVEYAREVGFIV